MQGTVWDSLKCTASVDKLNQSILQKDHLTYNYRSDSNIQIGVLGMIDDTLSISKCGITSVQKNSVINSFKDTQRLTLSRDKSVVYLKHKVEYLKGDWFQTIKTDFNTIKEDLDDDRISQIPKEVYRKYIKQKVEWEAFENYLKLKEKCKEKIKNLQYDELAIQQIYE